MKYFAKFLVILGLFAGCEGEQETPFLTGSEYLALQTGMFQVYEVQETRYAVGSDPEKFDYQIKSKVVDLFPSGTNQYTYVIHRSKRILPTDEWQPLDTWSVHQQSGELVVTEGNISYVKIKNPLTTENAWNGNILNANGLDEYQYGDIAVPTDLNGITFDNTLTVVQENNDDRIVFRDERREIYAHNVGLIYKESIQLNYCTADACLGQEKIDHGVEMKMVIKEYGKE